MDNKIISVYGNSGSYKTTTAIALARHLSALDREANVVLVSLDSTKPLLPILFSGAKGKNAVRTSLGRLLASERLDQDEIVSEIAMKDKIGVLAYNACENVNSHAYPSDARIDEFFTLLRHLSDYTIIDCTSNVAEDKLTAAALKSSDDVIQLVSCDLNGLVFYGSQESLLLGHQFSYANRKRYLTLSDRFNADPDEMKNAVSKIFGVIPCSVLTVRNLNEGRALEKAGKAEKAYELAISEIAEELVEYIDSSDDTDYDESEGDY